jgi:hypothetical protein
MTLFTPELFQQTVRPQKVFPETLLSKQLSKQQQPPHKSMAAEQRRPGISY